MSSLKLIVILVKYCFSELVQRMFKYGHTQHTTLPLDEELKCLIYGSPFYIIICKNYNLLKIVLFWSAAYSICNHFNFCIFSASLNVSKRGTY